MVQKEIIESDLVLDLGCGICQATTGILDGGNSIKCKSMLCVDIFPEYCFKIKDLFPTMMMDIKETYRFPTESYDVVLLLDVLEHLELDYVPSVLIDVKRITRKKVIIYTPVSFHTQPTDSWGMSDNPLQQHKCLVTKEMLEGFKLQEINDGWYGIWSK